MRYPKATLQLSAQVGVILSDYSTLATNYSKLAGKSLSELAKRRTESVSTAAGWTLNSARQILDADAEANLLTFALSQGISDAINDLFAAKHVNPSEDRPALHWALRASAPTLPDAIDVKATLEPALTYAETVRASKAFKTVLHLGIGGSDFGPRLLHDACKDDYPNDISVRFAANVDPLDLDRALNGLDPATTLVVGVSKSFSSEETMYNLDRARDWLKESVGDQWPKHMALVTASPAKAEAWLGEPSDRLFDMPISVGGRYSLWSNASLACMIAFGRDWFEAFLAGGRAVDEHVQSASLEDNLPLKLALLDYWNMTIRGIESNIVLSYSNALRMLPTYLQQLELESNGKSVGPDGTPISHHSIKALWGGEGTIGQHSYHQWLHQGTSKVAVEFIVALNPERDPDGTRALIAHALAQSEVLANGLSEEEIEAESPSLDPIVRKQKVMPGGHPSFMLACKAFDAEALGSLIALYEHRTFFAGRLWGINSFDQWGVERGKIQAAKIKSALAGKDEVCDEITAQLVNFFRG